LKNFHKDGDQKGGTRPIASKSEGSSNEHWTGDIGRIWLDIARI
jgi:hypothetical protein